MVTSRLALDLGFAVLSLVSVVVFAGCEDLEAEPACSEPQQIVREIPGGVEIIGLPSRTPDGRVCELTPISEPSAARAAAARAGLQAEKGRVRS